MPKDVEVGFDRLARVYQALERIAFGSQLHDVRTYYINKFKDSKSVLLLGDGDGRFLEAFLEQNNTAKIHSIDISSKMIECARERVKANRALDLRRVEWVNQDVREFVIKESSYDLIVAHYFFDMFETNYLEALLSAIHKGLKPGGRFLFSDFTSGGRGIFTLRNELWLYFLYRFFRLTTKIESSKLPETESLFLSANLKLLNKAIFLQGLIESRVYEKEK